MNQQVLAAGVNYTKCGLFYNGRVRFDSLLHRQLHSLNLVQHMAPNEAMKDLPAGSTLSVNCAESTEVGGIAIAADFSSMRPELANILRGYTFGS